MPFGGHLELSSKRLHPGQCGFRDVVLIEKAWCTVLLEVYRWCDVGFTMCSVQMNVCLKGHPVWNLVARDYVWESAVVCDAVLVEKSWCAILLEGYSR